MTQTVITIDTEYDARYTDRGVARLACMAYSVAPGHATLVGPTKAVELWLNWVNDDDIILQGHSVANDMAVLADEAYRRTTGSECVPGTEWAWELAHRKYDEKLVRCTEIRQRLTQIRFGPHKADVRLGSIVKRLFDVDVSDSKDIPDEAQVLLREAVPYSAWPADLLARTPWRVKYGWLLETFGEDVDAWPKEAQEYALDDVRWPWKISEWQAKRWDGAPIPDELPQTHAAWRLHLLAIPGWLADRPRAQSIRKIYQAAAAHCERTLIADGVIVVEPERRVTHPDKIRALVFAALGESAPLPKSRKGETLTAEQVRACCSIDDKAVRAAIEASGGQPALRKKPKEAAEDWRVLVERTTPVDPQQSLFDSTATGDDLASPEAFDQWLAETGAPELNAWMLWRRATAEAKKQAASEQAEFVEVWGTEPDEETAIRHPVAVLCEHVLVECGAVEVVPVKLTKKASRVRDHVYAILGDEAPLSKTKAEEFPNPTPQQRYEFCSTAAKTVRAAIIEAGARTLSVVDAAERSNLSADEFDAWLRQAGQQVPNAYAMREKAVKIQNSFLDRLDTDHRIRTSYQTIVDTGRTSARGGGGPGTLNIQQLPRDSDKPSHLHIRGCIVPDPGWAFIVADYSQLELCALAHVLTYLVRWYARDPQRKAYAEQLLGRRISETYESTLAQAINAGHDCHVRMAATLLGMSFSECRDVYERVEAKKKAKEPLDRYEIEVADGRQLAKPCNFGFPGGLGPRKFIDYAAGYGVTIDLGTAVRAKRAYMSTWIEMVLLFDHIGRLTANPSGVCVVTQIGSGRKRGDCYFTQAANSTFQGLAADGAKEALGLLIDAAYRIRSSPLYGCRPSGFIHDEFLVSAPREQASLALPEVERLMVVGMERWIPGVKIQAPGKVLYERWSK